jgi:condensin complex subunit 2
LDASVKIYSHRVDDTHASSHRILESLSRGGADDSDDQNVNADGKPNKTTAKVGSKHISSRLNIESTIEKNLENINMVSIEKFQSVDPTFYKMSKAFDEGGARGMLMNSLVSVSLLLY